MAGRTAFRKAGKEKLPRFLTVMEGSIDVVLTRYLEQYLDLFNPFEAILSAKEEVLIEILKRPA